MATVLNVTEILKRSDGTEIKISGDSKFYAQNNYANLILLDIEDGGSLEACALINFTQQTRQSFTSHDFFMKPVGIVTRVVNEEVITAYQYAIQVPKLVLQNNTKTVIETELTATISSGSNYKGYFSTLVSLNTSIPPTETLKNDLSIAYVVELEKFMQVDYNSLTMVYEWVEVDYVDMFLTQKQYSLSSIYIQPGYSSPQGIAPISVSNTQVIMNILNDLEVLYNSLNVDFTAHINSLNNPHEVKAIQVPFDNTGTQLVSANTEGAIKEVHETARDNLDLATENDWNFETIFAEKFPNSRNGWVQVDNEIYVFDGANFLGAEKDPMWSSEFSKKSYKYNIITKQLTEISDFPIGVSELRGVYKDGFIYLIGQNVSSISDLDKTYKYEISTDTYTLITNPPVRIRFSSGAVLVDNKIYVFVDKYYTENSEVAINTTPYIYDISLDSWSVGQPANIRFDRGYAYYYNGLIYVQRSLKFQAYNPTTDTWITDLTPPTYGVVHTGLMHEYKGRIFIGSGWESAEAKNNPFIQYYDVAEDKWFVATRLEFKNHALGYGSMFLYDNKLYYIGGYSNDAEPNFNNVIRSFDLEKLQFEEIDYQRQLITIEHNVIDDILDGTVVVKKAEQDQLGNVINTTYETKAVVSGINTRVINLENANMVKSVAYQPLTHIITFTFFDNTTQSLDLPLESTIVGASYDNITKDITFTLQNGSTLVVPLDDLVSGLASETWVTTYFIPKTALKDEFSTVPLNTNVPSEKLVKDELDKKELLENKANNFSVVNDTKYPSVKAVKDQLDLTAKLAVSNVFTQPQQVPNATLPQHTTNLSQVETMFEMFKRELRGYNFAMPDLTGKTEISAGVYRLSDTYFDITLDYNIYNGQFILNGTSENELPFGVSNFIINIPINTTYTINYNIINNGINSANQFYLRQGFPAEVPNILDMKNNSQNTTILVRPTISIRIDTGDFINHIFTLQIEKGSTATPYTVPGQIPAYKIVGEE